MSNSIVTGLQARDEGKASRAYDSGLPVTSTVAGGIPYKKVLEATV